MAYNDNNGEAVSFVRIVDDEHGLRSEDTRSSGRDSRENECRFDAQPVDSQGTTRSS